MSKDLQTLDELIRQPAKEAAAEELSEAARDFFRKYIQWDAVVKFPRTMFQQAEEQNALCMTADHVWNLLIAAARLPYKEKKGQEAVDAFARAVDAFIEKVR